MATLENGKSDAKSSRRDISFEFQSRDLPSRRLLGKGLSGIGYETAWKGAKYARKDFVGVQRDVFLQEAIVLVGLKDHKNIVKTYGWTVDKRSCSLVLEYMDEDLLSLLQKRMDSKRGVVGKDLGNQSSTFTSTQPVDLSEAVDMMLQIATGVEYLHEQGLAHGDLKTKNVLVSHRKDGDESSKVVKLSDFGLVGTKRKSKYIVSRKVRKLDMVRWKAPECLKRLSRSLHSSNGDEDETSSESESESPASSVPEVSSSFAGMKSSDVYSFALICLQILTGHTPYPDLVWKELMFKILSGWRPELPVSCPPLLRELLISCWGDPAERPSFSAVRMKLIQVQGFLTTAMGKRPQEAAVPSVADSPAHQAAVVPSTEVSRSSGNCLSPKPSKGPVIVPSEWTASVATMRSNAPGVPSAASSAPSPPATAAAPPAADESYVEIRSLVGIVPSSERTLNLVQRLEEALLRDEFNPSVERFLDRSSDQLVTTRSDLNNDPTEGRGSNSAGTSCLKKFIENEGCTSRICGTSATEVKSGTMDTGNAVVPSSFKSWQETCVLSPTQSKREKSNQWLLRRCFEILTLQRDLQQGIQTHGAVSQSTVSQGPPLQRDLQRDLQQGIQTHGAVSESIESQGPPLTSSCKSDEESDIDKGPFPHYKVNTLRFQGTCRAMSIPHRGADEAAMSHMLSERLRRVRQKENFASLRRLVPVISKNDNASILGDAITYLEDLKRVIHALEASKNQVERQYEDLKLSQQDLEQRNQQLEASKSEVERQYEDLKLSHQDLEQRYQQLEASKSQVERQYADLKLSHQDLEQRNKLLEARNNQVKNEYDEEVKLSHLLKPLPDARKNSLSRFLESREKHLPTVCQKDEPK